MNSLEYNPKDELTRLGLSPGNSILIGSGILSALDIRKIGDLDIVVDDASYHCLERTGQFNCEESYGHPILVDDIAEIRKSWGVLGRDYRFEDLMADSVIIGDVRYTSLDFLLRVKKSWFSDGIARQKDVADVELIEGYLKKNQENLRS